MSETSESGAGPTRFQVRPIFVPSFFLLCFSSLFCSKPLALLLLSLPFSTHFFAGVHPLSPVEGKPGGQEEGGEGGRALVLSLLLTKGKGRPF